MDVPLTLLMSHSQTVSVPSGLNAATGASSQLTLLVRVVVLVEQRISLCPLTPSASGTVTLHENRCSLQLAA